MRTLPSRDDQDLKGRFQALREEDQQQVQTGYECGIGLAKFSDIKEGDTIESYEVNEIART